MLFYGYPFLKRKDKITELVFALLMRRKGDAAPPPINIPLIGLPKPRKEVLLVTSGGVDEQGRWIFGGNQRKSCKK